MKYILSIWMFFFASSISAQNFSAYKREVFVEQDRELPYRILSPIGDTTKKYPLIVFLHGAFEKGNDNEVQLNIGGSFFLRDSIRKNYPAYIIFPQCPLDDSWTYFENKIDFTTGFATDWNFPFKKEPTAVVNALKKLIDHIIAEGKIDTSRIYIAGLSQGGMGVLDMLARYPDLFAAGLSMCGAGEPATAKFFSGKSALWLFHGTNDQLVPPLFSQQYFKRLKKAHSIVRYSEYPDTEHNCWTKAFAEPDLMRWLFAQRKL